MIRIFATIVLLVSPCATLASIPQAFEVATIKPSAPDDRSGKFLRMQSTHQFVAKNYTVKEMVAAAYNLPLPAIFGGPTWIDSDRYDIRPD